MPIFKAAENKRGGGKGGFKTSPRPTLDYITRQDKAAIVTSMYLNDNRDYTKQFEETRKFWNKTTRKNGRQYYHFIHSFSAYDDITPELAHEITEELCRRSFPHNELVIATHSDTDHIHCHIVINAVNFDDGKKLQISPKAYTAIKDLSNTLAMEHGLTPVDFRKPSKEKVRQSQAERQIILRGGTSWKQELCEVIDFAKQNSADMSEFEKILSDYGIELTRNTAKTIAYKHPSKTKAIRGEKLGADYTKEAILFGIEKHKHRADSLGYAEIGESGHSDRSAGYGDIHPSNENIGNGSADEVSGGRNRKAESGHGEDTGTAGNHRESESETERRRVRERQRYYSRDER